jgi:methionine-rich copper-binding protein CopC
MNVKRLMCLLPCTLLLLAMTACGNDQQQTAALSSTPVEAAFTLEPSEPKAGDTVTFSVTVTQDGKPVDDASEVKFEWWKEGQDPHTMLPATFQKDGLYIAKQPITEPGSYFVYYHVTARDFHTMKKIPFTVAGADGTPSPETPQTAPNETTTDNGQEQNSSHHH